jgi:hypothetical protein
MHPIARFLRNVLRDVWGDESSVPKVWSDRCELATIERERDRWFVVR